MEFKVIKGGVPDFSEYRFADGSVTDTRLMGVLGLYLHWKKERPGLGETDNIHQFYYYDLEELGLDHISTLVTDDMLEVRRAEKASFGGLGAKMREISEKEARYLVNLFVKGTMSKGLPVPPETEGLDFILSNPPKLTQDEISSLSRKMCTDIKTDFGAVNYYLMRCFGRDFEGAELLISENAECGALEKPCLDVSASFLLNTIETADNPDGSVSYLSQTLAEADNGYHIITSDIILEDKRVKYCKVLSENRISVKEASLLLNRDEYVSVFEVIVPMDDFDVHLEDYVLGCTKSGYESGDLYMDFRPDNSHIERKNFKLAEDVLGIYFSTDYGQLIVGAYDVNDIFAVESKLKSGALSNDIYCTGRYHFAQSVIYEFAQSGMTDFEEFLGLLGDED